MKKLNYRIARIILFVIGFLLTVSFKVNAMVPDSDDMAAVNDNTPWYMREDCNYYAFSNKFPYGPFKFVDTTKDIEEALPDDVTEELNIPDDDDYPLKVPPKLKSAPKPKGSHGSYNGNGYKLFESKVRLMPGGYTIFSNGVSVDSVIKATNDVFGFEFVRYGGETSETEETFDFKPGYILFRTGTTDECPVTGGIVAGCASGQSQYIDGIRTRSNGVAMIIISRPDVNLHEFGHIINFNHYNGDPVMNPHATGATSWSSADREGIMKMYNAVEDGWFEYRTSNKSMLCNTGYDFSK